MSSSEEDGENGNHVKEVGRGSRRPRLSDFFFVMGPQRPARQIFSIEEAFDFANEIGEALHRDIIIGCFLCVLIFVVIFYTILFVLVYKRVLIF